MEKAIQTSANLKRYHFKIEQQPAIATLEGDVDSVAKTAYLKVTLARQGVPPAEVWIVGGKAYGKHAYLNRYFKVKGLTGLPDYLAAAVALAQQNKNAVREEAGVLKLDVPLDIAATSQKLERQLDAWFKSAKAQDRHEFAKKALAGVKGLSATAQIGVTKSSPIINRVVLQTQSATARRASMSISLSIPTAGMRSVPSQALRATVEIPFGALFYRLKSIQGWCRKTHRFFARQSLNLIQAEDSASGYSEIYNNGKLDYEPEVDWTFNPVLIGSDYEDVPEGDLPVAWGIYGAWMTNPADYLKVEITRDYRHFGGAGTGLEDSWLFDLRDGESTPDYGERYYSARDWAYGAVIQDRNKMTFREAISQYGQGTDNGRKTAYLMMGHVVHLLQDQAMPDHASLIAHPGSASTDPQLYKEIPLCDLLAAEIIAIGCGTTCLPADVFCYLGCAAGTTGAAEAARAACEAGIDPNEMGYEQVVLQFYPDHYTQANINASVVQTGSVRHPDFNGYFQDVAALSLVQPSQRGLGQPLGVGGHPATAIVDYPVDPYIHGNSEAEKLPYLQLTDAVAVPAITRSAGLLKHFYEIVNPPPYVHSVKISQNNLVRFQALWTTKTDGPEPRREVTRSNRLLYPGMEATVDIVFGPVGLDGQSRKMSTVTVTLDGQPLPVTHRLVGSTHTYRGTFPVACVVENKTMKITITGTDSAPHLSGRTPFGNQIDRLPNTFARVANDPPYAFSGYEPGGTYEESFTVGPTPSYIKDLTEQHWCNKEGIWSWWQLGEGGELEVRLKIHEQGIEAMEPSASPSCGRYRFVLGPNIAYPKVPKPNDPSMWGEAPPSQFGLNFALADDPYSMSQKITIRHTQSEEAPSIDVGSQFRVPIMVLYEPVGGPVREVYRRDQELRLLGEGAFMKAIKDCMMREMKWQAWVGPWEEVEIIREQVSQLINISRGAHSGRIPEGQRGASYLSKLQAMGGREVLYITPSGQSSRNVSLQDAKITVAKTSDPKVVSVKAAAQTPLGRYVIPFSTGPGAAAETVIVVNVIR